MYRVPSSLRHGHKEQTKLNLIPILDSVFIFIFFLLVSSNFINLKELSSDVPILSDKIPDKIPLALSLSLAPESLTLKKGLDQQTVASYSYQQLEDLTQKLQELKKAYPNERTIILAPEDEISYELIVRVMDTVRLTPEQEKLFDNIIFGNIQGVNL